MANEGLHYDQTAAWELAMRTNAGAGEGPQAPFHTATKTVRQTRSNITAVLGEGEGDDGNPSRPTGVEL